ncbi:MAG: sigma-70 family RNA polymerase sigma factor, partial [Planctomycetota bacterium]
MARCRNDDSGESQRSKPHEFAKDSSTPKQSAWESIETQQHKNEADRQANEAEGHSERIDDVHNDARPDAEKAAPSGAPPETILDDLSLHQALAAYVSTLLRREGRAAEPADVDDVVQQTFALWLQQRASIQPAGQRAWVFVVAKNQCMLLHRKRRIHRNAIEAIVDHSNPTNDSPPKRTDQHSDQSPEHRLLQREQREQLIGWIETLPPEQQSVLRSRIYENK